MAPRACSIAVHIVNVRTMATAKSPYKNPRKALFKIKTPLWSAESTSANVIEADGTLPLADVDDAFEPPRLVI